MPDITIYDHQHSVPVDLAALDRVARQALPLVLDTPGPAPSDLPHLEEVEISIVDDAAMARIHADFLHDPSPTDVITFQHGEIIVSAETAQRQARDYGGTAQDECSLYIIHGLLHLNGHEDRTPKDRAAMQQLQESIVSKLRNLTKDP